MCLLINSCDVIQQFEVQLTEINNPSELFIFNDYLYVTDSANPESKANIVNVYSLDDFRLVKRLGMSEKENYEVWPGHSVWVGSNDENIFICDFFKMGFYDQNYELIKQLKLEENTAFYKSLGNKFIGQGNRTEKDIDFYTLKLFDENLKAIKEFYSVENSYNSKLKENRMYTKELYYQTYNNKIFVKGKSDDFKIDIYNNSGHKIDSINFPSYSRIRVTNKHKEAAYDLYKNHPLFGPYFDELKKEIVFPKYLPAIKDFRINDDKIYVLTYNKIDNKSEFFILDLEGRLIKKSFISLEWKNIQTTPYVIKDSKLYQVNKNLESGKFNLSVSQF